MDEAESLAELSARLQQAIAGAGGVLPFEEFMRRALYEPDLGYYERTPDRVGRDVAPDSLLFSAKQKNARVHGHAHVGAHAFGLSTGRRRYPCHSSRDHYRDDRASCQHVGCLVDHAPGAVITGRSAATEDMRNASARFGGGATGAGQLHRTVTRSQR